jgi:NAD(P)-dependent dehydrogenase (short-subunit alcohol dehydrogenase family)
LRNVESRTVKLSGQTEVDRKASLATGQVAVVTGASSGIGKALAIKLALQGVTTCLVGRDKRKLLSVMESVPGKSEYLRAYPTDLTRDNEIKQLMTDVERDVGSVDILIHGAAVISMGPMGSAPVADLDSQYQCNVRGPYLLTQLLLPLLRISHGQIVFLNSSAGIRASATVGQYAASKHALRALADSLREEINADGVRVLSVYLGRTATPMQQEIHRIEGRTYRGEDLIQPEEIAALLALLLAAQRSAEITDITLRPMRKIQ